MADQKLTQLTALATLSADDLFYVVDDPAGAALSRKMAASVLDSRYLLSANNLSDLANAAAARISLSLVIGTNVQAWDADLDTIAGLAKTDGNFIVGDGVAWTVESGATVRTSLGLGSLAVLSSPLPIANGGSGQVTQQAAIDALTNVAAATDEYVLTKDTATGNAIFKAAPATGAPVGAKYIVQQADGTLTNEQALGALATGLLKNTTTTGVLSIGAAGTDYQAPGLCVLKAGDTMTGTLNITNEESLKLGATNKQVIEGYVETFIIKNTTQDRGIALGVNVGGTTYYPLCISAASGWLYMNPTNTEQYFPGPAVPFEMIGNEVLFSNSRTNNAAKQATFLTYGYASANRVAMFLANISNGFNELAFGGGNGSYNAANIVSFYTAPTSTTLTGTRRLVIDHNGRVAIIDDAVDNTAQAKLHIIDENAVTNDITNVQILGHNLTGSNHAAAGFGTGLPFQGESSTTADQDMGRLYWLWPDAAGATHATRRAAGVLTAYSITTERECLSWEATSTEAKLSFLGATRIGRPASYTLAATATRTMPTPESAFTGQDNLQAGNVYAKFADLATLQTRLDSVEGVLRQLIIDLASTSGYGLLVAS